MHIRNFSNAEAEVEQYESLRDDKRRQLKYGKVIKTADAGLFDARLD